jgi:ABC-type uncharacterized transport system permease subunit
MMHAKWMINTIFAGQLLPPSLFPQPIEAAIRLLPFQYKFALPAEIFLGRVTTLNILLELVKSLIWLVIFYFALNFLWRQAIKKFTAVGN